jgi:hypothetical protein
MDHHASNFELSRNLAYNVQAGIALNEGSHNGIIVHNTIRAERELPYGSYKSHGDALAVGTSAIRSQNANGHLPLSDPNAWHRMTFSGVWNGINWRDWTGMSIANNVLVSFNGDTPWSNDSHITGAQMASPPLNLGDAPDVPIPNELVCGSATCPANLIERINPEIRTEADQLNYFQTVHGDFRLRTVANDPTRCRLRPGAGALLCNEVLSVGSTEIMPGSVPGT